MNKPAALIITAFLTFSFAAASMAADAPATPSKTATTKAHKSSKAHKKTATPPATTK